MSQAGIPNITPTISLTGSETISLLLSSIALEEMSLAHIMNAEAEKIQFVLGTLDTKTVSPSHVSLSDLIGIDHTVMKTLQDVILKEVLLQIKFSNVLELINKQHMA